MRVRIRASRRSRSRAAGSPEGPARRAAGARRRGRARSSGRAARALGVLALALAAGPGAARAQDRPDILITDPSAQRYRAAIQRFAVSGGELDPDRPEEFRRQIAAALELSSVFFVMDPKAYPWAQYTVALDEGPPFVCSEWSQIGADALVEGEMRVESQVLAVEFRVRDTSRCRTLVRKRYRGTADDAKDIAERIADEIVRLFTGKPGVASTEIAFMSRRSGSKEVFVMDADGDGVRRVTRNGSINNFPSWSPDGTTLLYTSYRNLRQPGLFLVTRGRESPGRILANLDAGGAQYRGVFSPDGERIAVVMSTDGASDIFSVRRDGRGLRRLTRHGAIDVGPSWAPDGRRIAFVSDRAGSPQIYVMDADGGNVRRVTYQGGYNTSPAWSPDGAWIAYESRVGGSFDIWIVDPEGSVQAPIVSHPRNDESPTWSPDGRKIAFGSTRRGQSDIYAVDVDGSNLRRLTDDSADDTSPAWGPYPY